MTNPIITVAIPSFNQGKYLQQTLDSVYQQKIDMQICVADGGSSDGSKEVLESNKKSLYWHQSKPDGGQSAAVNLAVSKGSASYIYWLNSDDIVLENALIMMVEYLERFPNVPAVYAKANYIDSKNNTIGECYTQPFSEKALTRRCIISQPATLIRRPVWEAVGGLDVTMHMAMDYDLWWKIYKQFGELGYLDECVAATRLHSDTKTNSFRTAHYLEAISVVKKNGVKFPWYWYLKWPWSVWYKTVVAKLAIKKSFK